MANPKRRHSPARRDRRRSHDAISKPPRSTCSQCGEVKLPHRACPSCGYYRDREIFEPKDA